MDKDTKKHIKEMGDYIKNRSFAPAGATLSVDHLIKLKKDKGPWDVIQAIVEIWKKQRPTEWESMLVGTKEIKESRKVTNVGGKKYTGVSKDKETGGTIRYTLDIPVKVVKMIRVMYNSGELPMDKPFYKKFGKKFPIFKISEKL